MLKKMPFTFAKGQVSLAGSFHCDFAFCQELRLLPSFNLWCILLDKCAANVIMRNNLTGAIGFIIDFVVDNL